MEAAGWMCLCLICLQGSLLQLIHGADCSGTTHGEDCVRPTTGRKSEMRLRQLVPKKNRDPAKPQRGNPGAYSAIAMTDDDTPLDRQKRHDSLPGSFSAKGSPNTLIQVQADRARRHLGQSGTKKKIKSRKSRVGSFSLLINNPSAPLQIHHMTSMKLGERRKRSA